MTDLDRLIEAVEAGEWRICPDFPEYAISESGTVWDTIKNRVVSQNPCEKGYPMVHVRSPDGGRKTRKVHVLVARTFLGPRPCGAEVRHKSGDKSDPSKNNLIYGTRSENNYDRKYQSLPSSYILRPHDVRDIKRRLSSGESASSIARSYGVHRCTIGDIKRGRRHADINA